LRVQLGHTPCGPSIRARLGAAACLLVAASLPAAAADAPATTRIELSALGYAEQGRAQVVEPTARFTRLMAGGQALSASLGIDVITGASPTGAQPAGRVQTTTTPSGNVKTTPADAIPTSPFKDLRGVLDLEWVRPVFPQLTCTLGGHLSREKDYQSAGASGKLALDVLQRLATVTVGAGYSHDDVFPQGGTRAGLTDGTEIVSTGARNKGVREGMLGLSRVVTRRWLLGVNASRMLERGYLTEPYKVLSLLDPVTGFTTSTLTENRPGTRDRRSWMGSSAYHFTNDVLYSSYRWYTDDWGVRSHMLDLKFRHELGSGFFVQPHVRLYTQSAARFFRFGLHEGDPLPAFATSDFRLGPLRSATLGATYGFRVLDYPGEFTVRAELLEQWGAGRPGSAVGVQRSFNLFPAQSVGSLVVGYTFER
jgi:hypothetical protein